MHLNEAELQRVQRSTARLHGMPASQKAGVRLRGASRDTSLVWMWRNL